MIESAEGKVHKDELEMPIAEILHLLGIPAHVKGYRYLREAIIMAINDPNTVDLISKNIYPDIAKIYNTTASRVERAMRHALEVAWKRGLNSPLTAAIFPAKMSKPKNSEFISELAGYIISNRKLIRSGVIFQSAIFLNSTVID